MTLSVPAFSFVHEASMPSVTVTASPVAATDQPVAHLVDGRISVPFAFGSSTLDPTVEVDRDPRTQSIDRLLIPPAANGSDITITVEEQDGGAGPYTSIGSALWTDGEWFDLTLTATTEPVIRVEFGGTGAWEAPELYLTQKRQLADWGDPTWQATPLWPAITLPMGGGYASRPTAGRRRAWAFRHMAAVTADAAIYDELLVATGGGRLPFVFDPPDTADGGPALVQVVPGTFRREQDFPAPLVDITYTYAMTLQEVVL